MMAAGTMAFHPARWAGAANAGGGAPTTCGRTAGIMTAGATMDMDGGRAGPAAGMRKLLRASPLAKLVLPRKRRRRSAHGLRRGPR